jgi:hypothetical protein
MANWSLDANLSLSDYVGQENSQNIVITTGLFHCKSEMFQWSHLNTYTRMIKEEERETGREGEAEGDRKT